MTWHDILRLYVVGGGTVAVLLLFRTQWLRRSLARRRWRAMAGSAGFALAIAHGVGNSWSRFGAGSFGDPVHLWVMVAVITLALAWLTGEVRLVHPWQRRRGFPHREGGA